MTEPRQEPVLDIAGGDPALSRHLRESLRALKRSNPDPEFGRAVDDVLQGRRSLREVAFSGTFGQVLDAGVAQFAERYEQLSEQERDELAEQGERELREQREHQEAAGHRRRREDDGPDEDNEWRTYLQ